MNRKVFLVIVLTLFCCVSGLLVLKQHELKKFVISIRNQFQEKKYNDHKPAKHDVWGIDISHHQKNVDWNEMSKRKPDFIFLKATEGSTHVDSKYKTYKKETQKLGIPTGAYHFFSYQSDGKKQAEHFLRTANLQTGDLLPVLDCEFKGAMPKSQKVTNELLKFLSKVEDELGVKPIIYCECSYYNKYLNRDLSGTYPLWISNFWKEPPCGYVFWQKTDKFKHSAFRGTVDYNEFRGSRKDLNKYQLQ